MATFKPVAYFGEYGVFAGEPRSASICSTTQVLVWTCAKPDFEAHLEKLPRRVFQSINAQVVVIDSRSHLLHRTPPPLCLAPCHADYGHLWECCCHCALH